MLAFFRSNSSQFAAIHNRFLRCRYGIALLGLLLIACGVAAAQNTTISGTVYDPRRGQPTTASVPAQCAGVRVDERGGAAALGRAVPDLREPDAHGRQCGQLYQYCGRRHVYPAEHSGKRELHHRDPGGQMAAPVQRDRWDRPADRAATEHAGEPYPGQHADIAIATGSVDGAECVLRDMGISDSEFTDDNQTVNAGGYVHLYRGSSSPGAEINASTPSETVLMTTNQSGTTTPLLNELRHGDVSVPGKRQQSGDRDRRRPIC